MNLQLSSVLSTGSGFNSRSVLNIAALSVHRCGLREHSMVPYKKLMDLYLDRSQEGRLQAILDDPRHRYSLQVMAYM